jgi:hypothetical protein
MVAKTLSAAARPWQRLLLLLLLLPPGLYPLLVCVLIRSSVSAPSMAYCSVGILPNDIAK